MGRHRAQARFDRAQWRLRFLIPLWIIQLVLSIAILGLFATTLHGTLKGWKDGKKKNEGFPLLIVVWKCATLVLGVISPAIVFFEVFRYVQETLTPRTILTTQFITFGFSVAALVLSILIHIQNRVADRDSIAGLILSSAAIASSLIPALYALRSHRRLASYDELTYPTNTKPYGFFADPESQKQLNQSSRASIISTLSGSGGDNNTPSGRRLSSASSMLGIRRLSGASTHTPSGMTPPTVTTTISVTSTPTDEYGAGPPLPLQSLSRSHSVYNHERDTQFEDYVNAKRNSQLSFREHVDHAFGADMGWNVGASPTTLADSLHLNRKGSVVNAGTFAGAPAGHVVVARVPSSSAHSLGAVPEEAEHDAPAAATAIPSRSTTTTTMATRVEDYDEDDELARKGLLAEDKYGPRR